MPDASVTYSRDEMMTVAAARMIGPRAVVFVGIGLPSAAANLARRTHAADAVLIYESGAIGAKPTVLPLSIGDGELAETADVVVSVPEMFAYWLQGGRVDLGFLGAAQIDRFGNINTTVIGGTYAKPGVRLPGAGGAPEIAASCKEVLITLRHTPRALVEKLDFITSVGHVDGPDGRRRLGLPGGGPSAVVTDLGILTPHIGTRELMLTSVHPGVEVDAVRAATGWPLRLAPSVATTAPPSPEELAVLRALKAASRSTAEPR
jgi:acyl CoA:acetate/3-ketoacid CoA transferase beta subunit